MGSEARSRVQCTRCRECPGTLTAAQLLLFVCGRWMGVARLPHSEACRWGMSRWAGRMWRAGECSVGGMCYLCGRWHICL